MAAAGGEILNSPAGGGADGMKEMEEQIQNSKPTLQRREDWPERLHVFLQERKGRAFEWGVNDCALLLCDAVLAMTDVDLAAEFRGKYSTELGAARAMKRFANGGVKELAEKIAADFGIEEIPVLMARRGDAVMVLTDMGPALGIAGLDGVSALFAGPGSIRVALLRDALKAWRI